ncbi:MAG TPA: nuclear transport factor 2 family protein [Solirubrobacterales bacterium]|jgi:ketosteroid isomerase-like protein
MADANIEIVSRAFEAIGNRDIEALLRLYEPSAEFRPLTGTLVESGGYWGHEGIRAYFEEVDTVWDQMLPHADNMQSNGDLVIVIGGCIVRGRESGAETDNAMAWVFRVRDGRIASHQAFSEAEEALSAAGLESEERLTESS